MKTQSRISAIVAMSRNRVIGKSGQLPWRLSEDLKRFKAITTGHPVIMGRKTFESIGKPLPQRKNIIITRQKDYQREGTFVVSSLDEALECGAKEGASEIFIIGGEEIYRLAFPKISRIYLTWIDAEIEGDAFFPEFDWSDFQEVSREDRQDPMPHRFLVLDRTPKLLGTSR